MKKEYIVLLFAIMPLFGICQINSSIDLASGVGYSYRILKTTSNDTLVDRIFQRRAKQEEKVNWSVGINFNKRLLRNFIVKSGLVLKSFGYKEKLRV